MTVDDGRDGRHIRQYSFIIAAFFACIDYSVILSRYLSYPGCVPLNPLRAVNHIRQ